MSYPVITIIGQPNVWKSRLFNRMIDKKYAIVSDIAWTTRDRIFYNIEDADIPFMLVDTGGLIFEKEEWIENDVQVQAKIAIKESDIVLFVVDSQTGLLPRDQDIAKILRKEGKNVFLLVSKCDHGLSEVDVADYYNLWLDTPIQVSAIHKVGIKKLMDKIAFTLKKEWYSKYEKTEDESPKIALLGRPNVWKSSLVNSFLKEERLIVSEIPWTTRDSTNTEVKHEKETYTLIDTAGIRRRGKVENGIEKWSIVRTLQGISEADVVCVLIDAEEWIVSQDQHVIEYALNAKKGIILIVNKWDTQEKWEAAKESFHWNLQQRFPFLAFAPVLFMSAKTTKNILKLFPVVKGIMEERNRRIPTWKINSFVREIVRKNQPTGTKRVYPKIFYMTQVDINPPRFKVFVNKKEYFHFSYFRYLENQLREFFGFQGTCLDIEIVDRDSAFQKK